jgi:anti-anti-sigma factor
VPVPARVLCAAADLSWRLRLQPTPPGELDLDGASTLRGHLDRLKRSYRGRLVLDLGAVEFIQSAGIAVLLEANAYASRDGWTLQIRPGPAHVQRVLGFTGMADRLPLTDAERAQRCSGSSTKISKARVGPNMIWLW